MDLVPPNDLFSNALPIYSFFKNYYLKKPIENPLYTTIPLRKDLETIKKHTYKA